jgi:exopolysaccharide biosynthesis polyprenyl glycosylphosphotransferase
MNNNTLASHRAAIHTLEQAGPWRRAALLCYSMLKRTVDIVLASLALLLLLPLLPFMMLVIRLDSPGPALFSQARVGQYGREFRCWKLRSMYVDAEARKQELEQANEMAGGVNFKMKRDPRITRVGRYIRKASIDELPQLWNVLIGDMSLVGPRPSVPSEVAKYSPYERCRLRVKPGITCLWQISGRSDLPFNKQVQLDVLYARSPSLARDLKILLLTVPAVLLARGAY